MIMYSEDHWTDHAVQPVFTTVIRATGPRGNINAILGAATSLLRQLAVPADRIERLRYDVTNAASYDQAVAFVEAWFPVERGD